MARASGCVVMVGDQDGEYQMAVKFLGEATMMPHPLRTDGYYCGFRTSAEMIADLRSGSAEGDMVVEGVDASGSAAISGETEFPEPGSSSRTLSPTGTGEGFRAEVLGGSRGKEEALVEEHAGREVVQRDVGSGPLLDQRVKARAMGRAPIGSLRRDHSDDDDVEPEIADVHDYFIFGDDVNEPVSLHRLPLELGEPAVGASAGSTDFSLLGKSNGVDIMRRITAWKLEFAHDSVPQFLGKITQKNGSKWVKLDKPRADFKETAADAFFVGNVISMMKKGPEASASRLRDLLLGSNPSEAIHDKLSTLYPVIERFILVDPALKYAGAQNTLTSLLDRRKETDTGKRVISDTGVVDDRAVKKLKSANVVQKSNKAPKVGSSSRAMAGEEELEDEIMMESESSETSEDFEDSEYFGDSEDDEDEEFGDSFCSLCDDGGVLLCCDGPCMRSFHASKEDGIQTDCKSLGLSKATVAGMVGRWLCRNCKYGQQQCYICGKLGHSSADEASGTKQEVFVCNVACCGKFYHPKCIATKVPVSESKTYARNIQAGEESFTCPLHTCEACGEGEDRQKNELSLVKCRRCPKAWHIKCLPRNLPFEREAARMGILPRAWSFGDKTRQYICYCKDHKVVPHLGTPIRNHVNFGHPTHGAQERDRGRDTGSSQVSLERDKARDTGSFQVSLERDRGRDTGSFQVSLERDRGRDTGSSQVSLERDKGRDRDHAEFVHPPQVAQQQRAKVQEVTKDPAPNLAGTSSATPAANGVVKKYSSSSSPTARLPGTSSVASTRPSSPSELWRPTISKEDAKKIEDEAKRLVHSVIENSQTRITEDSIKAKLERNLPSHYKPRKAKTDFMKKGILNSILEAAKKAVVKIRQGKFEDARVICDKRVIHDAMREADHLRTYLAPTLFGRRYTSYGRHFTKVHKLHKVVEILLPYIQERDMIVDFSCGDNTFCKLLREALPTVGKTECRFKNFDLFPSKDSFGFEQKNWLDVGMRDCGPGENLVIGLNPPFAIMDKFVSHALGMSPRLLVLIVPPMKKNLEHLGYVCLEDDGLLMAEKSFYLPGSVNVKNLKNLEQGNDVPPHLFIYGSKKFYDGSKSGVADGPSTANLFPTRVEKPGKSWRPTSPPDPTPNIFIPSRQPRGPQFVLSPEKGKYSRRPRDPRPGARSAHQDMEPLSPQRRHALSNNPNPHPNPREDALNISPRGRHRAPNLPRENSQNLSPRRRHMPPPNPRPGEIFCPPLERHMYSTDPLLPHDRNHRPYSTDPILPHGRNQPRPIWRMNTLPPPQPQPEELPEPWSIPYHYHLRPLEPEQQQQQQQQRRGFYPLEAGFHDDYSREPEHRGFYPPESGFHDHPREPEQRGFYPLEGGFRHDHLEEYSPFDRPLFGRGQARPSGHRGYRRPSSSGNPIAPPEDEDDGVGGWILR